MPRDSNGIYSLPDGYEAVTGEVILPSQHNPPLEDIAQALTGSVPRNGSAPMTGPLRAADGAANAPSIAFNSQTGTGLFKTTNGIGVAVNGSMVAEFGTLGLLASTPIGGGIDFWGDTAPSGWVFPYGQSLSRATFAALFAVFGTKYGAGDGTTTFGMPDKRDRSSFGKGDMGGTAANRITNQAGGWVGTTLGAAGGAQSVALAEAHLAPHIHGANVNDPGHTHSSGNLAVNQGTQYQTGTTATPAGQVSGSIGAAATGISVSIGSAGSGVAHNNLPPGIVCNYIIFTGVGV